MEPNINLYQTLFTHMQNLQPTANKKIKQRTYDEILTFVNDNKLPSECMELLIKGCPSKKIIGICELCNKKTSSGSFKGSTKRLIKIIHDWMNLSHISDQITTEFAVFDEYIEKMNLGEHYLSAISSNKKDDKAFALIVLKIIKAVKSKRPSMELSEIIRRGYVDTIARALMSYEEEKKVEEEKNKELDYVENIVEQAIGSISMEPKTWEDVTKLKNKKLLTTDFLSADYNKSTKETDENTGEKKSAFIDEEKELEMELVDNFVDPLTQNSKKLSFASFSDEDKKKLHVQFETFDPVFFLERFYPEVSLKQFSQCLDILDNNLKQVSTDDENLIDKNIYKYLDCKKLLDSIVKTFKDETNQTMNDFKKAVLILQKEIEVSLSPIKESFNQILKSKLSKEIIVKFSKYFTMKDTIENFLKFSNLEKLADYLKKINVEIKEISQNRYIYGEFYEYFTKNIEQFKSVLIGIIKDSSMNQMVEKHFRYLLEFDVESEVVDSLLNGLKRKMCERIKNDLEYTENFEIRNFKDFFSDEFNVENLSEDFYGDTIKKAEMYANASSENIASNDLLPKKGTSEDADRFNFIPKKGQINVEHIIKSLLGEIKEFLLMMKVLDETINLKVTYLQKDTKFTTIATEIYFVLFEKLKEFLFSVNFSMVDLLKKNLTSPLSTDIATSELVEKFYMFYSQNTEATNVLFNENFNKNTLQNLSNLVIELFETFEIYLNQDILESMNESKNVVIEKIFMAFLNEKILSNLNFFAGENSINFMETQLSIFNFSAFTFSKSFLKHLCGSYINIIVFYMNIVTKIKDVPLNPEIVYASLFFTLKCFYLKFYQFYQTESNYTEDGRTLNCQILEILKNYNYLKVEMKSIMKTMFRNKGKDYAIYLQDLESFIQEMRKIFIGEYINNMAGILLSSFVSNVAESSNSANNTMNSANRIYNFYEKYNDLLINDYIQEGISSNSNFPHFTDIRSTLIEMVLSLAESIKDIHQVEAEKKLTEVLFNDNCPEETKKKTLMHTNTLLVDKEVGLSGLDQTSEIIRDVINNFFEKLLQLLNSYKDRFLSSRSAGAGTGNSCMSTSNNSSSPKKNYFKLISQFYIEFQLFNEILGDFIEKRDELNEMKNEIMSLLLQIGLNIKQKNRNFVSCQNIDESVVYSQEELERKAKLLEEYDKKYSSFLKCFKIKE